MKEEESKFFTTSKFSLYRFRKKRIPAKTFSNFLPPCDVSSQSGLIIIFFSLFTFLVFWKKKLPKNFWLRKEKL